ncbi:hypothetical protein Dsin_014882 [Dipteronia sinensis]|uniref:A20-type domain-containing protein n=1 Tax=Dipteronia sinensis TaxID=43782 RepID=A0AAE0EAR2_9ROSI|nr:hypothetical protein Dsin_014882 [Dipteronia sinensis]
MDSRTTSNATSGRGLCVKGCGFYGSEETKNMCSKCNNHYLKTQIPYNRQRLESSSSVMQCTIEWVQ